MDATGKNQSSAQAAPRASNGDVKPQTSEDEDRAWNLARAWTDERNPAGAKGLTYLQRAILGVLWWHSEEMSFPLDHELAGAVFKGARVTTERIALLTGISSRQVRREIDMMCSERLIAKSDAIHKNRRGLTYALAIPSLSYDDGGLMTPPEAPRDKKGDRKHRAAAQPWSDRYAGLTTIARAVLSVLMIHASTKKRPLHIKGRKHVNLAWPSWETLMAHTNLSRKSIARGLVELERNGIVTRLPLTMGEEHPGGFRCEGPRTVYKVDFEARPVVEPAAQKVANQTPPPASQTPGSGQSDTEVWPIRHPTPASQTPLVKTLGKSLSKAPANALYTRARRRAREKPLVEDTPSGDTETETGGEEREAESRERDGIRKATRSLAAGAEDEP